VKAEGWSSGGFGEVFYCSQGDLLQNFNVHDIVEVAILNEP
jgi:hypothetical protein